MAALAVFLIASCFLNGISRGLDRTFGGPLDSRAQQLASAIGDIAYDLHLKHAVSGKILAALRGGGMSDIPDNYVPLGLKSPDYLRDTRLWNDLLKKAAHLDDIRGDALNVMDKSLTFVQTEDLGIIDFYKLSFQLFGYNLQGFYKAYFLLLIFELFLIFVAFWGRIANLVAADLLVLGLIISISSYSTDGENIFRGPIFDGRFLQTLAILPIFHLVTLVWTRSHSTLRHIVIAAVQVALLAFAVAIRSSANWGVLLIGASSALFVVRRLQSFWSVPVKVFVKRAVTPAIAVIVLVWVAVTGFQAIQIHPAYTALDELLPHHYVWHSLAVGLTVDDIEDLRPLVAATPGDAFPSALGNLYLKQITGYVPPSISYYYMTPFPEFGRQRSYERIVRAAYFDFFWHHPFDVIYLTVVTKPVMAINSVKQLLVHAFDKKKRFLFSLILVSALATGYCRLRGRRADEDFCLAFGVLGAMGVMASVPWLAAYPANLGDTFAVYCAVAAGIVVMLLSSFAGAWRRLRPVARRASE